MIATVARVRLDRIEIVEHDDAWATSFAEQSDRLTAAIGGRLVRDIEHIGSTSVAGLCAKPIVDMLAVVDNIDAIADLDEALQALSWLSAPEPDDPVQRRRSYCYPTREHRTHHLHVVEEDHPYWRGWLAFRNRLRRDAIAAAEYGALKRELATRFGSDPNERGRYRSGKAELIQHLTAEERFAT